jgi:hypothetical protein
MPNQMINNKLQIGHERKPIQFANREYPTHLGLCVMWRTMQYIVKEANKSYSVLQAAVTAAD